MDLDKRAAAKNLSRLARAWAPTLATDIDARGVELRLLEPGLKFYHSFVTGALARRAGQSKQALLRACNSRSRDIARVLDLTAGWGADGLTLARHGQRVTLLERNPLIAAVLEYSLLCLGQEKNGIETAARLSVESTDARCYLERLEQGHVIDCIYLDPMFPTQKSSAKPSGEMQLLQALTENHDIDCCFQLARASARRRVVVKRPLKAAWLGDTEPDIVYREKTIRFDVYLA